MTEAILQDIDFSIPPLSEAQHYMEWNSFTGEQKYILYLRIAKNMNYEQIKKTWKEQMQTILSDPAIKTCFYRSAIGLAWEKGNSGGNHPILCNADLEDLTTEMVERARINKAFSTETIVDYAIILQERRKKDAIQALTFLCLRRFGFIRG